MMFDVLADSLEYVSIITMFRSGVVILSVPGPKIDFVFINLIYSANEGIGLILV